MADKKAILITGGSRGIGRATALAAAARGWSVAFSYREAEDAARDLTKRIEAAGAWGLAIKGDVAEEADVQRMFGEARAAFGELDGVVANAGIVAPGSPVADMSADRLRRMFDVNVLGTFLTAREAARVLGKDGRSGSIVIVSSAAARLGSPNEYVDYAASKGACDVLVNGLSKELGPKGVRVNGVRPGLIETDIHASGGKPDRAQVLGATAPLGRAGTAEEVAQAIVWLLSDEASYVTGALLDVTGGR
ncbi:SDR family oxidoreductase [Xanthobacteraceae bacterium A53D]